MRAKSLLGPAVAMAAGVALAAPAPPKTSIPQSPYAKAFEGAWERRGSQNFDPAIPDSEPDRPPLTPKAAAQFKASLDSARAGKPINDPHARCLPLGMPRMMNMPFLFEIIPSTDRMTLITEEQSQVRRIWTDGRQFPDDMWDTFVGTSIGHWEGRALVVETRGMKADLPITQKGLRHSEKLVVTEQLWLEDADTLKDRITLTDPETFTQPWVATKTYKRTRDPLNEYVCEENNRNPVDAEGVTGVTLKGQ